jgi:hypothetical protein
MHFKEMVDGILRIVFDYCGGKDPVSEYNRELWNSGNEKDKETVRKQKRKLYYSNIYVVKDPANPSNEGKVFLFKYGKKSLIRLWKQCNQNLKMKHQSILLISGKVQTLN